MWQKYFFSTIAVTLISACAQQPARVQTMLPRGDGATHAMSTREWLIGVTDSGEIRAALSRLQFRPIFRLATLNILGVRAPHSTRITPEDLLQLPGVRFVEDNGPVTISSAPSGLSAPAFSLQQTDERQTEQWALNRLDLERAWGYTEGRADVKVAVVDTGIDYRHPDLRGRVLKGRDFVNRDDDAFDDNFHGTHCAGILAAGRNNGGMIGVAPGITLLAVKVLSEKGAGTFAQVAAGIEYAVTQGVSVISLSLGSYESSRAIDDAIAYAQRRGVLVIAGSGNQGTDRPFYPAANPAVLAVGATTREDKRARYSNVGRHLAVIAPGSDILSTIPAANYARVSGTSMAVPHVAGVAALIKSLAPNTTPAAIRQLLTKSALDLGPAGFDEEYGHGRLRPVQALEALQGENRATGSQF